MKRNNIHGEEIIYTSIESCKSVTFESLDLQMTYDIYISNLEPNLLAPSGALIAIPTY